MTPKRALRKLVILLSTTAWFQLTCFCQDWGSWPFEVTCGYGLDNRAVSESESLSKTNRAAFRSLSIAVLRFLGITLGIYAVHIMKQYIRNV